MNKKKDEKLDLSLLANRLEEIKELKKDGAIHFETFSFNDIVSVIQSCYHFDKLHLPDIERRSIVASGIFNAGRKGKITEKTILDEINKERIKYSRMKRRVFILATNLTCPYSPQIGNVRVNDSVITFSHFLPQDFERKPLSEVLEEFMGEIDLSKSTAARVRVRARSDHEAAEIALDSIDFIRGIWNFCMNRKIISLLYSGRQKPINRIRIGPVHTLHEPGGALATKSYWYEPQFFPHRSFSGSKFDWPWLRRQTNYIRKRIQKCHYESDIIRPFIRYARAMDSADHEVIFLKLWSLLEFLTDSSEVYNKTITRTLFLTEDKEFHRQILEHLRKYRNLSVHSDKTSNNIEDYVHQLRRYVEGIMLFHIKGPCQFTSTADAGRFLDLPTDKLALEKKLNLLRRASRFHDC